MTTASYRRTAIAPIEVLAGMIVLSLVMGGVVVRQYSIQRFRDRQICMARLGGLATTAAYYASENDGWILGSPNTSGAYLLGRSIAYGPAVQVWDFLGPIAEYYGLGFTLPPESGDVQAVIDRFNQIRNSDWFHCPSNGFIARYFPTPGSPNAGIGPMISYNTTRYQMFIQGTEGINGLTHFNIGGPDLPNGYVPRIDRVGDPGRKVWAADGARYSTATVVPDYDLAVLARWGGAFSDSGSYSNYSKSWDRSWANGNTSGVDARMYAFRHSDADPEPGAPGNVYKLNVAFHDGHVETQGDLTSSNPHQWLPTGSILSPALIWPDTRQHFNIQSTILIN